MTRGLWLAVAVGVGAGCDDDRAPAPAPIDPPAAACPTALAEGGRWQVAQCRDPRRLALSSIDGVTLTGIVPRLTLRSASAGDWPPTTDQGAIDAWPVIVWQGRADGGTLRLHDEARATVTVDVTLGDACVELTVAVEVAAADEVALTPLTIDGAAVGSTPVTDRDQPRAEPRVVAVDGAAVMIGALDPAWPLVAASIERMALDAPVALVPDAPLVVPIAVCSAADGPTVEARYGAAVARRHPRPAGEAPVGLRVDAAAPLDGVAADAATLAGWVDDATVVLDGAWSAGRGDWSDGPQFAEGIRAALPPEVEVAVVWPALRVDADGALLAEHPDWRDVRCVDDCPRLDPRIPAVRDHLAREALALDARGLRPLVSGLPTAPDEARALLAALPDAITLDPLRASPPAALGLSPTVGLGASAELAAQAAALRRHHWMRASARLDVGPVALGDRPAGEARQAATLALLAGVRLIDGGAPLDDGASIARALMTAPAMVDARPLPPAETPSGSAVWRGDRALAVFNPTDAPLTIERPGALAPALAAARPLFAEADDTALGALDRVVVPPHDVVVWVTVDGGDGDR